MDRAIQYLSARWISQQGGMGDAKAGMLESLNTQKQNGITPARYQITDERAVGDAAEVDTLTTYHISNNAGESVSTSRVSVKLIKENGRWKIDDFVVRQ